MNSILISSAYFYILREYLRQNSNEQNHLSTQDWMELNSLAEENFLQQQPVQRFNYYLYKLTQSLTSHEKSTLYYKIAQQFELKHYGLVGYISAHAHTFLDAIGYVEKYGSLIIQPAPLNNIHIEHSHVHICLTWPLWNEDCIAIHEINLFAMHRVVQQLFGSTAPHYSCIEIAHAAQLTPATYERYFKSKVEFNRKRYAFIFEKKYEHLALPNPDQQLIYLLLQQAESQLAKNKIHVDPLIQTIEDMLQQHLHRQDILPSLEQLAEQFHLSPRSLQRKLKAHDLVYRVWVEQLKMQYCLKLLEKKHPLAEIALQLGYADQSSLGRAFKKNFNMTLRQAQQAP